MSLTQKIEDKSDKIVDVNIQAPWLYHIHSSILSSLALESLKVEDDKKTQLSLVQLPTKLNEIISQIYPDGLITGMGKPLKFVSQTALDTLNTQPDDEKSINTPIAPVAYETYIANTGQIPTRENFHDLFNACIWITFPKTKAMLNRYQAEQINKEGISGSRGRIRDAITLLDENGAVLITSDERIATALKAFDWEHCLVKPRNLWMDVQMSHLHWKAYQNRQNLIQSGSIQPISMQANELNQPMNYKASVMICGHALIEQLVHPRKPLCAHTFILKVENGFFNLSIEKQVQTVDAQLVQAVEKWLLQDNLSPRQLCPLPILGIPYFCDDNANDEYYQDSYVFRSGRRAKAGKN